MRRTSGNTFSLNELLNKAAEKRQPASGTFELTHRCNLKCLMCYNRQSHLSDTVKKRELTNEKWIDIARQAADNGMVFLLLTGGEIFIRDDFFKIYEPIRSMGFVITLFTNGTLITREAARRLSLFPPNRIEITLYGASSSTYETITGVKGSFKKCCQGIENLLNHNIPLSLKITITRQNVNEIVGMKKLAKNWGVEITGNWLLTGSSGRTSGFIEKYRLEPEKCIELESENVAIANEWYETLLRGNKKSRKSIFYCLAGKSSFMINPYGRMNLCIDLPLPGCNVTEIGFKSAWKSLQKFVDNPPQKSNECMNCALTEYCSICPAWSYIETKTLNKPVSYICEIAKKRKI